MAMIDGEQGDDNVTTIIEQFERLQDGIKGFAAEMREKGIHVGMGKPGRCVNCGEQWPCDGSRT